MIHVYVLIHIIILMIIYWSRYCTCFCVSSFIPQWSKIAAASYARTCERAPSRWRWVANARLLKANRWPWPRFLAEKYSALYQRRLSRCRKNRQFYPHGSEGLSLVLAEVRYVYVYITLVSLCLFERVKHSCMCSMITYIIYFYALYPSRILGFWCVSLKYICHTNIKMSVNTNKNEKRILKKYHARYHAIYSIIGGI